MVSEVEGIIETKNEFNTIMALSAYYKINLSHIQKYKAIIGMFHRYGRRYSKGLNCSENSLYFLIVLSNSRKCLKLFFKFSFYYTSCYTWHVFSFFFNWKSQFAHLFAKNSITFCVVRLLKGIQTQRRKSAQQSAGTQIMHLLPDNLISTAATIHRPEMHERVLLSKSCC